MQLVLILATLALVDPIQALAEGNPVALKPGDSVSTCVQFDVHSSHIFKPGCSEVAQRAGRKVKMSYNAQGLRDKEYSAMPKPGWTRILLVGMSRLVGPGLEEKNNVARRLEVYLGGAKKKVEVINAGVEGYSPILIATRMQSWLDAYHPTHVVFSFDIQPAVGLDSLFATFVKRDEAGQISLNVKIADWLRKWARLRGIDPDQPEGFRRVFTWQSAGSRMVRGLRCRVTSFSKERYSACLLKPTLEAVAAMRKQILESGSKLFLLIPPGNFTNEVFLSPAFEPSAFDFFNSYTLSPTMSSAFVQSWLRKNRFIFSVMIPVAGSDLLLPGDYHFNEVGSDLFARSAMLRIQPFLEGKLLPGGKELPAGAEK